MPELYGVCLQGLIPLRAEPSHRSEMVSQLLFGETFSVLEEETSWIKISTSFDSYQGWITRNNLQLLNISDYSKLNQSLRWTTCDAITRIKNVNLSEAFYIAGGSYIYHFNEEDLTFRILDDWFQFLEKPRLNNVPGTGNTGKIAMRYVHTPYLWGGRTIMGIDCSGFSQIVYKIMGIPIPRDASQQVSKGKTINFISQAREGDLAFFDNEEGKITHVGVMLSGNEIIHSSGLVRIDSIDQTGIFNLGIRNYTHKLRIIKRLI